MHIVSYRGPAEPGGVSRLIEAGLIHNKNNYWWHMNSQQMHLRHKNKLSNMGVITPDLVEGHYRYANEFLWPLFHDRPDLAKYETIAHQKFAAFNMAFAWHLLHSENSAGDIFINDYQFALLPELLHNRQTNLVHFWHIPWPKVDIHHPFTEFLLEIARSLLSNRRLGFHTQKYIDNFLDFVDTWMPDAKILPGHPSRVQSAKGITELFVNPASVDLGLWEKRASIAAPPTIPCEYILSVDRADYAKGILERIAAIREFFAQRPDQKGKIQFVFICQRSRSGLEAFDRYWEQCRSEFEQLSKELSTATWAPVLWIDRPMDQEELAGWYAKARALLVNAPVDGLNLTAKEFVVCSQHKNPSLILSTGAGAWQELHNDVVSIWDTDPAGIARSIIYALNEYPFANQSKMRYLKATVRKHNLNSWWQGCVSREHEHVAKKSWIAIPA